MLQRCVLIKSFYFTNKFHFSNLPSYTTKPSHEEFFPTKLDGFRSLWHHAIDILQWQVKISYVNRFNFFDGIDHIHDLGYLSELLGFSLEIEPKYHHFYHPRSSYRCRIWRRPYEHRLLINQPLNWGV